MDATRIDINLVKKFYNGIDLIATEVGTFDGEPKVYRFENDIEAEYFVRSLKNENADEWYSIPYSDGIDSEDATVVETFLKYINQNK